MATRFVKYTIVMLVCLLVLMGCLQGQQTNRNGETTLLDSLLSDNGFVFEQYDWFIQKDEFLGKSGLTENDFDERSREDILVIKKQIYIDKPKLNASETYIIYTFDNDVFVSGTYSLVYDSKKSFANGCKELKGYLDEELGKPFSGNTEVLNTIPSPSGSGQDIIWEGSDGSWLVISIFNHEKTQDEYPYIMNISTKAPRP